MRFRSLLPIGALIGASCTGSIAGPVSAANCEPVVGRVLTGDLEGEQWEVRVEEVGGFTMLSVMINDQDLGAVEADESTWYHAGAASIVVLTGGLPSRTTQAVVAMVDGSFLALCPFGDGDLLVAAGALGADEIVDLEFRRGGDIVAIGHVGEMRRLASTEQFAFSVTPPGVVGGVETGVVRSPGAELTFDDDEAEATEP